ncbi:MAG: RNA polymerase sigma factor [Acidobacteria bacterium]|nr:RNA polymerase sigma factor [Acidobacteriota bacterium]
MQLEVILAASEKGRVDAISQAETVPSSSPLISDNPESRLIEEAKQGNDGAFEALYHAHKRRIYSLCLRMTGNTAEAEDLTQEAFLQMFRKISSFRGDAAFSTWLHRLAVNLVLMRFRKKGLLTTSLDDTGGGEDDNSHSREIGTQDSILTATVDRVVLEKAIQELPAGYRMVFYLHDVEGYEHREIAGMMGCSVGNCKSQLHKARLRLRELLLKRSPAKRGPR